MYKRIPATSFDTYEDVYFAMIDFMQECGFTVVSIGGIDLGTSEGIKHVYVLQDPNTKHKLCFILQDSTELLIFKHCIHVYIFDDFVEGSRLNLQGNIPKFKYKSPEDSSKEYIYACGVAMDLTRNSSSHTINEDLVCIYINKTLMFVYVPINCYVYSHVYSYLTTYEGSPTGGILFYYGNFTKYHIGDIDDCVFLFCSSMCSYFGNGGHPRSGDETTTEHILTYGARVSSYYSLIKSGILYCHPEATFGVGRNNWYVYQSYYDDYAGYNPSPTVTSFDYTDVDGSVVDYFNFYSNSCNRFKLKIENTLNNISILQPLIVYIMREPNILRNWSAIGESRLVNLIGMQHISSGDVFIDTSIEKDYHKYFTFHCFDSSQISTCYTFLGLAIEIEAKEDLLHSQSEDYLTINLNDRFRNFDRIEVVYGDNKEIEWQYDDLKAVYDTEGIFNLTKDDDERCLVYGLKNTDGKSTEYRFTCSESCKIISITGYRE